MNGHPPYDLIDEPPQLLIKPTLMTTINGMDHEHKAQWSKNSLEELDDGEDAIALVEEVVEQIKNGTLNTDDTNTWILNMLYNTPTYSDATKFNILAIVLNQYCQDINTHGDGISQAEFDLTSLLIQHTNEVWHNKPYSLKLGK